MLLSSRWRKEPTVYISLSVADAKTVFTKSTASGSERGVTASCTSSLDFRAGTHGRLTSGANVSTKQ